MSKNAKKFDKNGFPIDYRDNKRVAKKLGISVENVEVTLRRAYHKLAEILRKKGHNVPTDPQKEAEYIAELSNELFRR